MSSLSLLKAAFLEWKRDHASYLAAAISYYAIFSLAPLLIIVLAITGAVYGQASTQSQFIVLLQDYVGRDSALTIQQLLSKADLGTRSGTAFAVGLVLTLVGSIGVFARLQEAVTIIWKEKTKKRPLKETIAQYLLRFLLVLVSSVLLISSLIISAVISKGGALLGQAIGLELHWLLSALNQVVSLAMIIVLFAILFRSLPEAEVAWRSVWKAAIFTGALFNIGKYAIGFYLGHSSTASAYGAAGSLIALLIWIFYAAQLFLYGVELVKVQSTQKIPV